MKLILCHKCNDLFKMGIKTKFCSCGRSSGKYIDNLKVVVYGDCSVWGIDNNAFFTGTAAMIFKIKEPHDRIKRKGGE